MVRFHQDVDTAYDSIEELVHNALYSCTAQERQTLKDFMSELLSGKYDEMQLREVWLKSKADVLPFWGDEGNCTEVLKYLQGAIEADKPPAKD